jgi:hypothetical protein
MIEVMKSMEDRSAKPAIMHPADHISAANVYVFDPNNISGGRYQRVIT